MKRTPTAEQMRSCASISEAMRKYRMGHAGAKGLLIKYGIDYDKPNTSEHYIQNERNRAKLAMQIRRMKGKGVSDRDVAAQLGISRWQVTRARAEYEIGHKHGNYHG